MSEKKTIVAQILSKIINTGDYTIIANNDLDADQFFGYKEEFEFIQSHYNTYGNVPDDLTFLTKFPDFDLFEVNESSSYLVETLLEENYYVKAAEILNKSGSMLNNNSFEGVDAIVEQLDNLRMKFRLESNEVPLYGSIKERIERSKKVSENMSDFYIPTGFAEIDKDINGLQRGNELAVIYARTNNGKSWVSEAIANFIAEIGYKVGYFSPEMSAIDLGYRVDALHGHLSNNAVRLGRFNDEFSVDDYEKYAESLQKLNGDIFVKTPKDFNRKVTVSKLKNWIKKSGLNVIVIDGIKYMTDERKERGDSLATSLTNVSEDLIEMSGELGVPVVVVVQANRGGVMDRTSLETPDLENIKDSDGIAQNASLVWAVRKITRGDETFLLIDNKKARNGENGQSYKYRWKVDVGQFEYVNPEDIPSATADDDNFSPKSKSEVTGASKRDRRRNVEDEY